MRTAIKTAALVAALSIALPATAAPEQLDARTAPRVEGPLLAPDEACSGRAKVTDSENRSEVIAVARSCVRFYRYDPEADGTSETDYGFIWMQSNVNARKGWCARKVRSKFEIPEGSQIEGMSPPATERKRRKETTISLRFQPSGETEPATVAQDLLLYPRTFEAQSRRQGALVRLAWAGSSRRKLAFAGGAVVSWDALEGAPEEIPFDLGYRFAKKRTC